jgi:uncharacterized DUF497 family protein
MEFRWIEWNIDHAAKHGVTRGEIEDVVRRARPPFPRAIGDDKLLVIGRGTGGRWVQETFLTDDDGDVFVIHARPLSDSEKRRYRR